MVLRFLNRHAEESEFDSGGRRYEGLQSSIG
jgi:hypothetical protein